FVDGAHARLYHGDTRHSARRARSEPTEKRRMADENDRRREARAPIELKVEYKRLNTFFYDYTKNISKGGTFIKTEKPLDVGTIFLFKLMLPAPSAPRALRGEVRWVVKDGSPLPPQVPEGHEAGEGDKVVLDTPQHARQ